MYLTLILWREASQTRLGTFISCGKRAGHGRLATSGALIAGIAGAPLRRALFAASVLACCSCLYVCAAVVCSRAWVALVKTLCNYMYLTLILWRRAKHDWALSSAVVNVRVTGGWLHQAPSSPASPAPLFAAPCSRHLFLPLVVLAWLLDTTQTQ